MSFRPTSALVLLSIAGCSPHSSESANSAVQVPTVSEADDTALAVADMTASDQLLPNRYIVRRTGSSPAPCTSHGGWTVSPLFAGASDTRLMRYCVYETDAVPVPALPSGIGDADPDRLAIAGMGAPTAAELVTSTLQQLDPVDSFTTTIPAKTAWLGLLDTVPTLTVGASVVTASANDPHGTRLASLAQRAICDGTPGTSGTSCAGLITSQNAIGWTRDGSGDFTQPSAGGSIGSQGDVAAAIFDEVHRWRTARVAAPSDDFELVLNLSLGWHPSYGGTGAPSTWPVPVQAVYEALRYASCNDALVLAAAGHIDTPDGGSNASGPLFPAAWEKHAAPKLSNCSSDYGGTPGTTSTSTYRPLVYAVGAIDVHENPLVMSRPGSLPPRVAPGSHLAAFDGATGLSPLTGTSVATAVVSSAATVVRTVRPDLSAHDTMKALFDGGAAAGFDAEYCRGSGSCGEARIVSVCAALAEACVGQTCGSDYKHSDCGGAVSVLDTSSTQTPETNDYDSDGTCASSDSYWYDSDLTENDVACPMEELPSGAALSIVRPMPPFDPDPWGVIEPPVTPGVDHPRVILDLVVPPTDLENMAISIYFQGDGPPDHYQIQELADQHAVIELPLDALEARTDAVTGDPLPVIGGTFDYAFASEPFSYQSPLYMEATP